MSVAIEIISEKNNMAAPMMGSYGYVGLIPSLKVATEEFKGDDNKVPTFGWIYRCVELLGLCTYELDNFSAFLKSNEGSKMHLTTDHDDWRENIDMDNLVGFSDIDSSDYKVCRVEISLEQQDESADAQPFLFENKYKVDKFKPARTLFRNRQLLSF